MNDFATDAEAATYRMLKQVLQNHVALQEMSILATSMVCTGLLGDRCLECCAAGTAPREVVADMLGWLKYGVRARQTLPALLPFEQASAYDPEGHLGEHSRCLYDALRRLLNDVSEARRIDSLGSMQIVLRLMADASHTTSGSPSALGEWGDNRPGCQVSQALWMLTPPSTAQVCPVT